MLDSDFQQLFARFARTAFRLETLPEYRVAEESVAFASFLAGQRRPANLDAEWLEVVSRSTASGKAFERVHVVPHPLTPYLHFEFVWGYKYSAQAGESIFVLESDHPSDLLVDVPLADYWLFDDQIAVEMEYDGDGRFRQARKINRDKVDQYVECRARLKAASTPLDAYLAREPFPREYQAPTVPNRNQVRIPSRSRQ